MFACLYQPPAPRSGSGPDGPGSEAAPSLADVAREFSPRVQAHHARLVMLDVSGLSRLFGAPAAIGAELRRAAADRGLHVHVALASTQVASAIIARARAGITVVPPGEEAARLAPLPLDSLLTPGGGLIPPIADPQALLKVLRRWGLKTLGDLAALPAAALSERIGQQGLGWQQAARGEDGRPLLGDVLEEPFEASLELEWPIEGLEPLSFVLGRLCESLAARLDACDRAAAVLHVRLRLVTRAMFERRLELPSAIRDPRVLRTLVVLDLESHPVPAGIDAVTVAVDVVPGRIFQGSLLARALPTPERLSTLLARLTALVGEARAGSAVLVDSHRPGAFTMTTFAPSSRRPQRHRATEASGSSPCLRASVANPPVALRRFRIPVPAHVVTKDGQPAHVATDRRGLGGGPVEVAAGPWRTSGEWWRVAQGRLPVTSEGHRPHAGWNRDEWDVALADGAVYRISRDRDRDRWVVDGMVD